MNTTLKYALGALAIIIVMALLTQTLTAGIATVVGIGWTMLRNRYWSSAVGKMKPPSGGIKVRKESSGFNWNAGISPA